jgi:hypothetical protein
MSTSLLRPLTAGALALAMLIGTNAANADDPKTPAPVTAEVKVSQKLSDATLKAMLENMGYTPTTVKTTGGGELFRIKAERQGVTYTVSVGLSSDREKLWFTVFLNGNLPKDGKIAAPLLLKLLQLNDEIGPCHFFIKPAGLYMGLPIDNIDVTPVTVRANLDIILGDCTQTRANWQIQDWATTTPPATAQVK